MKTKKETQKKQKNEIREVAETDGTLILDVEKLMKVTGGANRTNNCLIVQSLCTNSRMPCYTGA
ncbi:MAG: hypothetical protein LUF04_00030 [Bacteroides sp.]|nr:hypothetical protein [Bacteroides sp.]